MELVPRDFCEGLALTGVSFMLRINHGQDNKSNLTACNVNSFIVIFIIYLLPRLRDYLALGWMVGVDGTGLYSRVLLCLLFAYDRRQAGSRSQAGWAGKMRGVKTSGFRRRIPTLDALTPANSFKQVPSLKKEET